MSLKKVGITPDGKSSFAYDYSQGYQAVQALYEESQLTFDPNAVAAVLQSHPYHIDSLLTMADVYRSTGDNAYAGILHRNVLFCSVTDINTAWQ